MEVHEGRYKSCEKRLLKLDGVGLLLKELGAETEGVMA